MKTLFEQFREQEAKLRQARKVSHSEVEAALLGKMSYLNVSIQEIKGTHCAIHYNAYYCLYGAAISYVSTWYSEI